MMTKEEKNNLDDLKKLDPEKTASTDDKAQKQDNWEEKYKEAYDAMLRAKAEVENIKKRSEKEISNAYKFSTESIFLDLIPIFESLDIASSQDAENISKERLIEGNDILKKMFDGFFEKNSLEVINPINQSFDPNLHQAIKTIEDKNKENNLISEVLQKGYKLSDRILKPALVVVIKN
tara:strand:- start:129 stop:662 length:534 start_codon:yes stop_codon:yes gene_type:complete